MKIRPFGLILIGAIGLVAAAAVSKPQTSVASFRSAPRTNDPFRPRPLPLFFEPNVGQANDERVRFLAHGPRHTLFLMDSSAIFRIAGSDDLKMMFGVKTKSTPKVEGLDVLGSKSNYFHGTDPARWKTGVSNFRRVAYRELYPGIDLIFYEAGDAALEYDFVIEPGSDYHDIRLSFEGARSLGIDDHGNLQIALQSGQLVQQKPVAYQERDGRKVPIESEFVIREGLAVEFSVKKYDPALPLVIDPALSIQNSTFFGGLKSENTEPKIYIDPASQVYLIGETYSTNFPVNGGGVPYQAHSKGDLDVTISKFDGTGQVLRYSTYLGGGFAERSGGIVADSKGIAYITGTTWSNDFPTTKILSAQSIEGNAFVAKLSPNGDALQYSVILGGSGLDGGSAIAIDASGAAYVAGQTSSANFPKLNPAQGTYGNGSDAFVTKIDTVTNKIVFSTFLGGNSFEAVKSIAVGTTNYVYVVGNTGSKNFPTAHPAAFGTFQPKHGGGTYDAFLTVLDSNGAFYHSTYFGGSGEDEAYSMVLVSGNIYIAGDTDSKNFPVFNAFQPHLNGTADDLFLTKFASGGSSIVYSTLLGGTDYDQSGSVAVDADGAMYLGGCTSSGNFPMQDPIQAKIPGSQSATLSIFEPKGDKLRFSTYLGGKNSDFITAVGVDGKKNVVVAGTTNSPNFPTKAAFQPTLGGNDDIFVTRFGKSGRVYLR